MWIPIALAALNIGVQLYTGIANNQALKNEAKTTLAKATEANELAVIQSDAAYLAALSESNQSQAELEAQKAVTEKRLNNLKTISVVVALVSAVIIIVYFVKRKSLY
ncbi:subtilase family serine protease [Runella defluvii]|uniref:Subtilase family serine protease n=1 Tax=Runella defluvii TaxID=370973 RepID=A0A7W5ZNR3_9BACT|nr:hypothetical protein [Runella defluvii]MBB3840753.1 subtilase family serine protease [Runella defluvii]